MTFKEPTPPDTPLHVRSKVIQVKESTNPGVSKASVEVDVSIYEKTPTGDRLLVHGTGVFVRMGALRAL